MRAKSHHQDSATAKTPDGILARLARQILALKNIDHKPEVLKILIDRFLEKNSEGISATTEHRKHYIKSNLFNEITKNKMTMKVFVKFLMIMQIKKVVFIVRFVDNTDEQREVSQTFNLNVDFDNQIEE